MRGSAKYQSILILFSRKLLNLYMAEKQLFLQLFPVEIPLFSSTGAICLDLELLGCYAFPTLQVNIHPEKGCSAQRAIIIRVIQFSCDNVKPTRGNSGRETGKNLPKLNFHSSLSITYSTITRTATKTPAVLETRFP